MTPDCKQLQQAALLQECLAALGTYRVLQSAEKPLPPSGCQGHSPLTG